MLTVKELEEICKRIGDEYGHDTKVRIHFKDYDSPLKCEDNVRGYCKASNGTLYLMNQPFKDGKCE